MLNQLREYFRVAYKLYGMYFEKIYQEKHPLVAVLYYALIVSTFPIHFLLMLSMLHLANSFWEQLVEKMLEEKLKNLKEDSP